MKILANPDIILTQVHTSQRLPHLAIELSVDNHTMLIDGQRISFSNFHFNLSATVFKPSDGSRLILKDFTIEYITSYTPTFFQKFFSVFLVKKNIYWAKSQKDTVKDIENFLTSAGKNVLFLGSLATSLLIE